MAEAAVTDSSALSLFARPELLHVAESVATEKGIEREEVLLAMEQAIQKAGRSKYGHDLDIRATIDRRSGAISLHRYREVAEEVEFEAAQLTLDEAREIKPDAGIGEFIVDPLPPIDFGRIAAQTAKQVIVQQVREAERLRQYGEYKDRVGEIVNGLVKRVEFGNVMVDLGRAEAVLRREELIPRENFRVGDRVRAYIADVREEVRGPQIFLSRTHPDFMARLFAQEVPEIYDGIIEIRAVARDPGSRAKIAVISNDAGIDPVGACVGMRGSRVQAVVAELQGEKIDIVPWSPDAATFVVNALAPAEVVKVVLDEEAGNLEVIVPDELLSKAIGRRGQNVRLASQLSGWDIDILTESEESERRTEEFRQRSGLFIEALDVDDVIAHLLVTEGFSSLEEVAFVPLEDVAAIEGFDEDVAEELRRRAREFLEKRDATLDSRRVELGVEDAVMAIPGITPAIAVILGEAGVLALDDLADLSSDEFRALIGISVERERQQALAEAQAEADAEAAAEAEAQALADAEEAAAEAEAQAEADAKAAAEAEAQAEADAEAAAEAEAAAGTEPGTEAEAAAGTEPGTEAEAGADEEGAEATDGAESTDGETGADVTAEAGVEAADGAEATDGETGADVTAETGVEATGEAVAVDADTPGADSDGAAGTEPAVAEAEETAGPGDGAGGEARPPAPTVWNREARHRQPLLPIGDIRSVDDLVSLDDSIVRRLCDISGLSIDEANDTIMAARAHWFGDEEPETGEAGPAGETGAAAPAAESDTPPDAESDVPPAAGTDEPAADADDNGT